MPEDSRKQLRTVKEILAKIKGYFKENWGTPCIIGFMLFLMVSGASLSIGLDFLAKEAVIYAYYALVIGVVLQIVCFLKYGEKGGNKE